MTTKGKPQYKTLARDAFGRFDYIRYTVPKDERKTCAWCGQPAKYQDGTHGDGLYDKPQLNPRQFCGASCYKSFGIR